MRLYYYAFPNTDGQWEVVTSRDKGSVVHATRELALLAANASCRRHWEQNLEPCGVRCRLGANDWEDLELYGQDDDRIAHATYGAGPTRGSNGKAAA